MKLYPIPPNTTNQTAGHPNSISRCGPNQFNCKSDPNACIEMSLVCDGIYDCIDRSDEEKCSPYTQYRNRTKKDDMAANKLARLIGLWYETLFKSFTPEIYILYNSTHIHPHIYNKIHTHIHKNTHVPKMTINNNYFTLKISHSITFRSKVSRNCKIFLPFPTINKKMIRGLVL